ncbi:MAG: arabinan endo-1,5-alpha-L-arabinosidase [Odoribacteraceae bacterium]|jgi:arabinan endo-1,5-alpha-L-arabinosidase|nr:arabinan endo-1,5-alpha-L-arabinosidase [Odoribacteraceae bacterium]
MYRIFIYLLPAILLLSRACTTPGQIMDPLPPATEKPGDTVTGEQLTVSATVVSAISRDGARLSASFTNSSDETVVERGFCYAVTDPPTINDRVITDDGLSTAFSMELSGLEMDTRYATRAYARTNARVVYGPTEFFRTMSNALANYVAPAYADDYSQEGISSWNNRARWNLANVHDPTVEKCGEYFYMYTTDASYGNVHAGRGHFPYRRSRDLVNWEFLGMAMSNDPPAWIKDTLNNIRQRLGLSPINNPSYGYWAPVVRKVGDKYRMYYSIPVDNYIGNGLPNTTANFDNTWTERAFIGLMETTDLATNVWEDKGMVVYSATDRGVNWARSSLSNWDAYFKWNAIDPSFIIDRESRHWLVYGSWHSGIVALELDPATGKPSRPLLNEPDDFGALVARQQNSTLRWQPQEAPEIIYNPETGFYYLFLAYDELSVAYNTRVCRSTSVLGPYTGYDGANITVGANCFPVLTHPYRFSDHPGWVGISHCCVFRDPDAGRWFYASQGRLPANAGGNPNSNAIMMGHVREILWTEDGWPVVMPERYAGVPRESIAESEIAGTWENIILSYSYGRQQVASEISLTVDKRVTGAITGAWSYDPLSGILVIGDYRLRLQRGLDWEANPRAPTLVYAGITSRGTSIWGKKRQ